MSSIRLFVAASLVGLFHVGAATAATRASCPPAGYTRARLQALQAAGFEIADPQSRRALALGLMACLASRDPWLRDAFAFEALSRWLRGQLLDAQAQSALVDDLLPRLVSPDPRGFERPFAALVLSELVRAERLQPYFTDARRQDLTDRSIAFFRGVRDYRGFDDREGWRHGVAHGSDLLLQWVLNPKTDRATLLRIRDAIGEQVAPDGHAYIHGESERLARPILVMARSGVLSADEWTDWLRKLVPANSNLFASQRGLALRHNINAFLEVTYVNAKLNENAADDVLLPGLEAALKAMP